jgi:uncharacterized protein YecT (DUF1311 family)
MKAYTLALLVGMLSVPLCAVAAKCGDLSNQGDMNQCALRDYQKADKQLNKVYNSYRNRLDDTQKRQFRDVQLAWVKFRNLACAYESSGVEGGSVYPFISNSCLIGMTHSRIKEITNLARCEEGDLSCPAWK